MQNGDRAISVKSNDHTTVKSATQAKQVNGATSSPSATPVYTNGTTPPHQNDESTLEDDSIPARPSKKRRLNDPLKELRPSPSRPTSPPWRRFAVEGPTSVIVGGRRVSSRNNPAAATAEPPSQPTPQPPPDDNKRRTRGVVHETPGAPRPRGASLKNSIQPVAVAKGKGKNRLSDGGSAAQPESKAPSQKRPRKSQSSTDISQSQPAPAKRNAKPSEDAPAKRRRQSPSSPDNRKKRRQHRISGSSIVDGDEIAVNARKVPTNTFTGPSPRLRLKLRAPTIPLLHPGHIPPARKYASFHEWIQSDDALDEDDKRDKMTDERVRAEVDIRLRLLRESRPGGLLSKERCSIYAPDPSDEPPLQYGPWNHIAHHAVYFQKLQQRESTNHKKLAKQVAHDCSVWFRELVTNPKYQGKYERWKISEDFIALTAEELAAEAEALERARYKGLMRDLAQSWELVKAEVDKVRLAQYDEEQRALGKKEMKKMLGQSAAILGQRLRRPSDASSLEEGEEYSGSDVGDDEDYESMDQADYDAGIPSGVTASPRSFRAEEEIADEEDDDSENMSSSEDDQDEIAVDDDADLTQEQLRFKYQNIPDAPMDDLEESRDGGEDENEDEFEAQSPGLEGMLGPSHKQRQGDRDDGEESGTQTDGDLPDSTFQGVDPSQVKLEEVDEALMDDTDEPTTDENMSDSDDEETIGTDDEDADESTDEAERDENPLWGFFSNKRVKELREGDGADAMDSEKKSSANSGVPLVAPDTVEEHPASDKIYEEPASAQRGETEKPTETRPALRGPESTDGIASSHLSLRTSSVGPLDSLEQSDSRAMSRTRTPPTTVNTPTSIKTEVPSLLRGTLREYQHHGLDWLAGLYASNTNGILADEMGLGKTIQTIALLAHLADRGVWGPHLVVVPTSVMLNWEMEFKKFCPGFKVLTYYGDIEERKRKRSGWRDDNKWNVVITSYQLILKDAAAFKQRSWFYLILDEAHNIKNFQTQRWQTLLTFKTQKRLLLTGTPLQNNLSELWSLLFFLMPSGDDGQGGFTGLHNFTTAMSRPTNQILEQGKQQLDAEAQATVDQLHSILRPYLLRRLKVDVEKQMPGKYEHVIYCRLSKRQRQLYDEFMGRTEVRQTLASGNYMSIINCLMSLRKVCNHPDLFETRQITTSFAMRDPITGTRKSIIADYEIKEFFVRRRLLQEAEDERVGLDHLNLVPVNNEPSSALNANRSASLSAFRQLERLVERQARSISPENDLDGSSVRSVLEYVAREAERSSLEHLQHCLYLTRQRAQRRPIYGTGLLRRLTLNFQDRLTLRAPRRAVNSADWYLHNSSLLQDMILNLEERSETMQPYVQKFACITPAVVADDMPALTLTPSGVSIVRQAQQLCPRDPFHEARMRLSIAFPDKRLLQYDCGKLQRLDILLRQLQAGGHRALIFTQMTKVLDILEQFLNIHGHRYLRLDGATKIEQRQILTDRFNNDPRILCFILSSRSGGLGINLTGADTVIFYDLDWNPAMDKQCQDRCHRIGQTRDVHIYRFVSEHTIEANILRKSNQKRLLDDVIIQKGDFTTDYFNRMTYRDALDDLSTAEDTEEDKEASAAMDRVLGNVTGLGQVLESVEDKEDTEAAKVAQKEMVHDVQVDQADFNESSHPSATPKTSVPPTPIPGANEPAAETAGQSVAGLREGETVEYDDARPHVDEFMVRHLMWERRDEKFVPPRDRRERRDRRGRDRNRKR